MAIIGAKGNNLVSLVQKRRNAIHAFKNRQIGTGEEFWQAVRRYQAMLEDVDDRLPYP